MPLPPALQLVAQPLLAVREPNATLDFEILLRQQLPDGSLDLPGPVIAAARRRGEMAGLDLRIVESVLAWLHEHQARLAHTKFVEVNIDCATVIDIAGRRNLLDLLRGAGKMAALLAVDLRESDAVENTGEVLLFAEAVRALGMRVVLDDLGGGYSKISLVRDLMPEGYKISGALVSAASDDYRAAAVVAGLTAMAAHLGGIAMAAHVDSTALAQTAIECGATYLQGFGITRPMSLSAILSAPSALSLVGSAEIHDLVGGDARRPDVDILVH